jgi:hypothetical protein
VLATSHLRIRRYKAASTMRDGRGGQRSFRIEPAQRTRQRHGTTVSAAAPHDRRWPHGVRGSSSPENSGGIPIVIGSSGVYERPRAGPFFSPPSQCMWACLVYASSTDLPRRIGRPLTLRATYQEAYGLITCCRPSLLLNCKDVFTPLAST